MRKDPVSDDGPGPAGNKVRMIIVIGGILALAGLITAMLVRSP